MRFVALLRSTFWVAALLVCRPCLGQLPPERRDTTTDTSTATLAFGILKSLAGTWSGRVTTEPDNPAINGPIQVVMRVASRGNVLVHEIAPGGVPEPTLIYVEGNRLPLLHYCEAGNRPRLVVRRSSNQDSIQFDFLDISGSTSPLYLNQFVFTVISTDHHAEDWTFSLADGTRLRAHFDLIRAREGHRTGR